MSPRLSAIVLHYNRLERLSSYKHSSLLGSFVNYEEDEELGILPRSRIHST